MVKNKISYSIILCIFFITSCKVPFTVRKSENRVTPPAYAGSKDSTNTGSAKWKDFFKDPNLAVLIDTALKNNQELNIIMQEINIANSEVLARKGSYLPYLGGGVAAGVE